MLKVNDHIVLNFVDLQEAFSPWEIYEQREAFAAFAEVHCCPLTTWIKGENGTMDAARYLDKGFWMALLRQTFGSEMPDSPADPMEIIRNCLEKLLGGEIQKEEAAKRIGRETEALCLDAKLEHICTTARLTGENACTAVVLLALCELAETDARKQDFRRWQQEAPAPEQHCGADGTQTPDQGPAGSVVEDEVAEFPEVDKLVLKTRREPYRYRYYEPDTLTCGTMKTVRVEAAARSGRELRIELCREDGTVALTLEMKAGEYRDCTVADNRVIRFLPTLSISDTLCIARKNYASTEITVIPRNAPEWLLNVDAATARKISCFAAGDNAREGFLYLRNGRLMKGFYKPNENYGIRQQLEMVDDRLVEVRLAEGCYELLTEHGEILSNNPRRNGMTGVVSLYTREMPTKPEFREWACSDSGASTAVHEAADDQCAVSFG